ncbi:AI-2E family transporter [Thiothrix subterranea]|uniref:AI-2E family transporter n=1 Tax=Thiothrix subterranea TaxID=2735563 RepID=UPI00192AF75A|nr:AI-2E family transporter [Thiothrix subterranea]QQZ27310.1 AI-2E family transporter [Thiothrix subterranea]
MEGNAANNLKIPVWGIFIISMGVVLYVAKAIFIPMTLAIIASFLLTPAVNYLQKFRIPSTVSSFLILLLFFTLLLTAINYLADPVSVWVERLPAELRHMEGKLILFRSAITDMWAMTDKSATIMVAGNNPPMHDVMVGGSNILFTLLDNTQSSLTFNHIGQILLPPLALVLLNLLEEFVLPLFVGKVFTINPILIFLFILFLGWLWGMAGIFMAVPLLMIIKIVFDQTQAREIV